MENLAIGFQNDRRCNLQRTKCYIKALSAINKNSFFGGGNNFGEN